MAMQTILSTQILSHLLQGYVVSTWILKCASSSFSFKHIKSQFLEKGKQCWVELKCLKEISTEKRTKTREWLHNTIKQKIKENEGKDTHIRNVSKDEKSKNDENNTPYTTIENKK